MLFVQRCSFLRRVEPSGLKGNLEIHVFIIGLCAFEACFIVFQGSWKMDQFPRAAVLLEKLYLKYIK